MATPDWWKVRFRAHGSPRVAFPYSLNSEIWLPEKSLKVLLRQISLASWQRCAMNLWTSWPINCSMQDNCKVTTAMGICSQLILPRQPFLPRRQVLLRRSMSSTMHTSILFVVQRCAVWISHQCLILSKTRIHDQSRSIHSHSISFTKITGIGPIPNSR